MNPIEYSLFLLKKLVATALLPPFMPLLLVGVGLILMRRYRFGVALAWAGLVLAVLLATPAVVSTISAPLQRFAPPNAEQLHKAQAIVILGSGRNLAAAEYGGQTISRMSLERVRYGARLARQTGLPVLVTGGAPYGGTPEAQLMREALEQDFGVAVRWAESASNDTEDNARMSAKVLREAGITRVLVVTHAMHMRRSIGEFSRASLMPLPAPTGFYDADKDDAFFKRWVPSANGAYFGWFACHEWLGILRQEVTTAGR